jgi:hypothetical protein
MNELSYPMYLRLRDRHAWKPYSIDGNRVRMERVLPSGRLEYRYEDLVS